MAALNKVSLIGNLGRDPEIRMAGTSKVANFSLAITEKFKDRSGNNQEKTEWVNIVFWGRQAEICEQYLRKGSSVYIEGKLETSSWDDQTGQKRYKTEVRGLMMQMLGRQISGMDQSQGAPRQSQQFNQAPPTEVEDDLPF